MKDAGTKDRIRNIEVEILDRYDALVSALVMRRADWELRAKLPIGINVAREGSAV